MSRNHSGNIQPQLDLEEHEGDLNSKRVTLAPTTFYQNASLVSGYTYYGMAIPNSNPTVPVFRLQRENLDSGEVLFATPSTFSHQWSAASLASISYS